MGVLHEISQNVRNIKPLVSSLLTRRASQIKEELRQGVKKPYKEVIDVCWDDSHRAGVKPLSFVRQVLATCIHPQLVMSDRLPMDVKQRAQTMLRRCDGGSVGSYADTSHPTELFETISEFMKRRDRGASAGDLYISPGSLWSLTTFLSTLVKKGSFRTGVLTPVPGHCTTISAITGLGAVAAPYQLSEEHGWELHLEELLRALESAKRTCNPVALYIINPGSPSGHVQSRESIQEVIRFVSEKKLFLLVNEVYQDCVYGEKKFISYKRVLREMGPPFADTVELASFHSASKGLLGESGLRCGYMELVNVDPTVKRYIATLFSANACAPTLGQIALDLMLNPPQPGDPSYPLYKMETQNIWNMLIHNVKRVYEVINSLPNFLCQSLEGGTFAFPRLYLPLKAIQRAKDMGMEPDTFYCIRLLEDAGVLVSPGCEYGQKDGTYHIRICITTTEETMEEVLQRLACFHTQFMKDFK
ncbi:alanine aminotransferase 1-like [Antennarius striatus]|uniref:alanine aminotransferase 1-like n=1 Tax=Antennarius striatus TaxID=241820 RepID=UPI0035AEBF60